MVENKLMFKNDVWARKIIWKDQLMIACIRTHVESIGSKWRCLRILTNIVRHMESIHNASRQVLQSNKLLRIFGGSNSISMTIVKHMNNWGMSGYWISARIIRRGIQVTKNSKAVSSRILGTTEIISGYLVITRSTGKHCMNGEYMRLSIGVYRWKGIAKAMNTSSRVNSGEYLQGLLVQQTIISNKGLSGWKW